MTESEKKQYRQKKSLTIKLLSIVYKNALSTKESDIHQNRTSSFLFKDNNEK